MLLPVPGNNGTRIEANKGSNCFYNLQASLFILGALVNCLIDINCLCFHTQNSDDYHMLIHLVILENFNTMLLWCI